MQYDFDQIINRADTDSIKYDKMKYFFGRNDLQPLWVADMDFATPDFILSDLKNRLKHPILGYTMRKPIFFESYKNWAKKRYNWEVQNQWLDFSPGVVGALAVAILALTDENDEIIIQPPVYHPFFEVIKGNQRKLVENPLQKNSNGTYQMDFDDLRNKITDQTKMILIANPHNPVGRVWNKEELQQLGDIAVQNNLIILSDDIHADFVYKPHRYIPIASLNSAVAQQTITVTSPSKTFNIAGLSTSVVIIPNEKYRQKYNRKLTDMHLFLGNIFGNIALVSAYQKGEEWLEQLLQYLKTNRDFVIHYLNKKIPAVKPVAPEGTFLMWLDFSNTGLPHEKIKDILINKALLALNDGKSFGTNGEKYFRLNFALPRPKLKEALQKLEIFSTNK